MPRVSPRDPENSNGLSTTATQVFAKTSSRNCDPPPHSPPSVILPACG
jgi:hypothetical protein